MKSVIVFTFIDIVVYQRKRLPLLVDKEAKVSERNKRMHSVFSVKIVKSSITSIKKFKLPISSEAVNKQCREEWSVTGGFTKDEEGFDVTEFQSGAIYSFIGFAEQVTANSKQLVYCTVLCCA